MGWKTLKQRYDIGHIVQVGDSGILIGSGYVPDLLVIDQQTGTVRDESPLRDFGRRYPRLMAATPEEILDALSAEDAFSSSIPVYTVEHYEVVERHCEEFGYPNATHDGRIMYDDMYSTDRNEVVEKALRDMESNLKDLADRIERDEAALNKRRDELAEAQRATAEFERREAAVTHLRYATPRG